MATGLLHQIQSSAIHDDENLSTVLLKLRVLAARLNSKDLSNWIKCESEGYPRTVQVPPYRVISVNYVGTFLGPFGSGVRNAPVPPYLIEQYAGEQWTNYQMRDSVAAIDDLVQGAGEGSGTLEVAVADLILLLQGKIYSNYSCNEVRGIISRSALMAIRHSVRSKVLDFTLELEKQFPISASIDFGTEHRHASIDTHAVGQIYQQTIYGDVTNVSNKVEGNQIAVAVRARNVETLIDCLASAGILKTDASELAQIVASEEPGSRESPFGERAKKWLGKNLNKALDGTWKIGISSATSVLSEAVKNYYGL